MCSVTCLTGMSHLKKKNWSISRWPLFERSFPVFYFLGQWRKPMKRDAAEITHEWGYEKKPKTKQKNKLVGPSVQPSSFVVLSSRSSSLSKSLWSLLAMVFLLLSSWFPFLSWTGNGFTGNGKSERERDESDATTLCFKFCKRFKRQVQKSENSQQTII